MTDPTTAAAPASAPALPTACTPLAGGISVPISLIAPSPLNPRKRWNSAKVAEMSADLKAHGQIQPIRLRPNPAHTSTNGTPPFEIVVGETRWRAAPDAGLDRLDAVLSDCTDQQLIQLALSENSRRQELHPLEEADAYAQLLHPLQGYANVQTLAAAVGVSPSYVYQRLKLRSLCDAGRTAFLAGTIDASVALLIARMPDPIEQATATAKIIQGFGGDAFSFRAAAEYLRANHMLALGRAKFDITAAYQVAGPCSACNKRSGAAPDLFADVTGGDMCQDARCYQAKTAEAHAQLITLAKAEGHQVLQGDAARRVLPMPSSAPMLGHHRTSEPCPALTDSRKPLGELLGTKVKRVLVEHPQAAGTIVELVTTDAARKALKAKGLLRDDERTQASPTPKAQPAPGPTTGSAQPPAASAAADLSHSRGEGRTGGRGEAPDQAERQAREEERRLRELKERTGDWFGTLLLINLRDKLQAADEVPLLVLRLIISSIFRDLTAEACTRLYTALGWDHQAALRTGWDEDLAERLAVDQLDGRQLAELLALVLVAEQSTEVTDAADVSPTAEFRPELRALVQHFAIDAKEVEAKARAVARAQMEGGDAPSAAGAAGRELDATAAFLQQHGSTPTAAPASQAGAVIDHTWQFPINKDRP